MTAARVQPGVALIGYGAIGRVVAAELLRDPGAEPLVAVLVRPSYAETARAALPPQVAVVETVSALLGLPLSCVVECAGQGALAEYGPAVLDAGLDLIAVSVGALTDDTLHERCRTACRASGASLVLPAGAIAGLDGLQALRAAGLERVRYVSRKPPHAWRGTEAERLLDLEALIEPKEFFRGSARQAASRFPKNANLAAIVALAGLGLDETEVSLVADPGLSGNVGRIEAQGRAGRLEVTCDGAASADNPKTSATTAFSLVEAVRRRGRRVRLG